LMRFSFEATKKKKKKEKKRNIADKQKSVRQKSQVNVRVMDNDAHATERGP
jgi:hypothetical protein